MHKGTNNRQVTRQRAQVIELGDEIKKRLAEHQQQLQNVEKELASLREQMRKGGDKALDEFITSFQALCTKRDLLQETVAELATNYEALYLPLLEARIHEAFEARKRFMLEVVDPAHRRYYEELVPQRDQLKSAVLVGRMSKDDRWARQRELADVEAEVGKARVEMEIAEQQLVPLDAAYEALRGERARVQKMLDEVRRAEPSFAAPFEHANRPGAAGDIVARVGQSNLW